MTCFAEDARIQVHSQLFRQSCSISFRLELSRKAIRILSIMITTIPVSRTSWMRVSTFSRMVSAPEGLHASEILNKVGSTIGCRVVVARGLRGVTKSNHKKTMRDLCTSGLGTGGSCKPWSFDWGGTCSSILGVQDSYAAPSHSNTRPVCDSKDLTAQHHLQVQLAPTDCWVSAPDVFSIQFSGYLTWLRILEAGLGPRGSHGLSGTRAKFMKQSIVSYQQLRQWKTVLSGIIRHARAHSSEESYWGEPKTLSTSFSTPCTPCFSILCSNFL